MITYNLVNLVGYIDDNPVFERVSEKLSKTTFHIRIEPELNAPKYGDEAQRKNPEPEYIPIKVINKTAEAVMKYCRVGDPIFITGKVTCFRGTSRATGKPYEIVGVSASRIQFLGHSGNANGGNVLGTANRDNERMMGPGQAPSAEEFRCAPPPPAPPQEQQVEQAIGDLPF